MSEEQVNQPQTPTDIIREIRNFTRPYTDEQLLKICEVLDSGDHWDIHEILVGHTDSQVQAVAAIYFAMPAGKIAHAILTTRNDKELLSHLKNYRKEFIDFKNTQLPKWAQWMIFAGSVAAILSLLAAVAA